MTPNTDEIQNKNKQYQVAISCAEAEHDYAERLAHILERYDVSVFYKGNEQGEVWGQDLYQYDVLIKRTEYCVIFVSKAYSQEPQAKHELKQAQARAFREDLYILPIRVDDTEIPGLTETTKCIYLKDYTFEEIAKMIRTDKLRSSSISRKDTGSKNNLGKQNKKSSRGFLRKKASSLTERNISVCLFIIIFSILIYFVFNSPTENSFTLSIIRLLAAFTAALGTWLFPGELYLEGQIFKNIYVKAVSAFAMFVFVFFLFYSLPAQNAGFVDDIPPYLIGSDGDISYSVFQEAFEENGGQDILGFPISNVYKGDRSALIQEFSGGTDEVGILIKPLESHKAFWVGGEFWLKFEAAGVGNPTLGYPTTNRYPTNDGWRQDFARGGAILQLDKVAFPVFGGIGVHYLEEENGELGRLGFPISIEEQQEISTTIHQKFENGYIRYGDGPTRTVMNSDKL
ncbi:TIR domain-containing protein [Leptothoe sp. LEGE 181152]|nr:TIR domain-containing protein [Leptothoe sp. LEGE 181152]